VTSTSAIDGPAQPRLLRLGGLTLLLVSLLMYRSYERHPVLGRWSYTFAAVIIVAGIAFATLATHSWRAIRQAGRRARSGARRADDPHLFLDLAIFVWGCAYLLTTVEAPVAAARILSLNLIGSDNPAAALLAWVTLVILALGAVAALARRGGVDALTNARLFVGTMVVMFLVGEGVCRVLAVAAPEVQDYPTHRSEMWRRRYAAYNDEGFRDVNHSLASPRGAHRLLLVGDSYVFGWGIRNVNDRFGEQLGAQLRAVTGERWDVINAGLPASDTPEETEFLKRMMAYKPDAVILEYVFNDIGYLAPLPRPYDPVAAWQRRFGRASPLTVLFVNSFLFEELYIRLRRFMPGADAQSVQPYLEPAVLAHHLQDLSRFVALARSGGALVGIVPFDFTVHLRDEARQRYEAFVAGASAVNLPVWPAEHVFDAFRMRDLAVNRLDAHPNALANRLMATHVVAQFVTAFSAHGPAVPLPDPRQGAASR
jgi:GDSL-like Lipase/Acylhydrolase family